VTASDPRRAIEAVWRIEAVKLIAGIARLVRDVCLAEELAQDALVAALRQWPGQGVPDIDAALDDDVGDDLLRLVFTACHPVLSTEARIERAAAREFHISEREHEADQMAAPVFRGERVPLGTAFGSEFKNSPAEQGESQCRQGGNFL